jgi:GNAT superfamily N-acetyltransferase
MFWDKSEACQPYPGAMRARDPVDIVEFEAGLAEYFRQLNMEWLERFFVPEGLDHRVLDNPFETIIAPGGSILFARIQQQIVGTCALIVQRAHPDHYELAKMAVTADHQGNGVGRQLLTAAIAKFVSLGGTHLHLETSSRLRAALRLYLSHGFIKVPRPGGPSPYARADVYMEYSPAGNAQR